MEKKTVIQMIESQKGTSAWRRGVKQYALDILENLEKNELPESREELERLLLNGATDWKEYSYCDGGSALIYDCDIADRLCTPSELKRKKGGELPPSSRETWMDVQATALFQAYCIIRRAIRKQLKD